MFTQSEMTLAFYFIINSLPPTSALQQARARAGGSSDDVTWPEAGLNQNKHLTEEHCAERERKWTWEMMSDGLKIKSFSVMLSIMLDTSTVSNCDREKDGTKKLRVWAIKIYWLFSVHIALSLFPRHRDFNDSISLDFNVSVSSLISHMALMLMWREMVE